MNLKFNRSIIYIRTVPVGLLIVKATLTNINGDLSVEVEGTDLDQASVRQSVWPNCITEQEIIYLRPYSEII